MAAGSPLMLRLKETVEIWIREQPKTMFFFFFPREEYKKCIELQVTIWRGDVAIVFNVHCLTVTSIKGYVAFTFMLFLICLSLIAR